jgi:hypothetical protein
MWEQLRRFSALEPGARGLFLRAFALLPLISLSLRARGFRATQFTLQKYVSRSRAVPAAETLSMDKERAARVALSARMVRSATYRSFGYATCLEKSLALWWLLGRQGIPSTVRIGTRKTGGKFEAHAWVECNGVPLNEPAEPHSHYAAFDEAFPVLESAKK